MNKIPPHAGKQIDPPAITILSGLSARASQAIQMLMSSVGNMISTSSLTFPLMILQGAFGWLT